MTRPRLRLDSGMVPGLAAVALFVVMAVAFLGAALPSPAGFAGDAAVMRSLGAAMFNLDPGALISEGSAVPAEGFLVVFEIIDVVLVAALVGAVMLARREVGGENVTLAPDAADETAGDVADTTDAVAADGGREGES